MPRFETVQISVMRGGNTMLRTVDVETRLRTETLSGEKILPEREVFIGIGDENGNVIEFSADPSTLENLAHLIIVTCHQSRMMGNVKLRV